MTSEIVLHPTRSCYDDAAEIALDLLERHGRRGIVIVHALCVHPQTRELFAHAWVERGSLVYQLHLAGGGRVLSMEPLEHFASRIEILHRTAYALREATALATKTGLKTGPWDWRYRQYVGDVGALAGEVPAFI